MYIGKWRAENSFIPIVGMQYQGGGGGLKLILHVQCNFVLMRTLGPCFKGLCHCKLFPMFKQKGLVYYGYSKCMYVFRQNLKELKFPKYNLHLTFINIEVSLEERSGMIYIQLYSDFRYARTLNTL